jgi:hypothetical protein
MVSKCANPECGKPLHYLRDGKVFLFELKSAGRSPRRVEHFWLCGDCSGKFDVRQAGAGVEVVPRVNHRRPQPLIAADAA